MITIIGPTASGKTALAAHLAADYTASGVKAEILSGDSRQVYRGMDIGTGKDLCDYDVMTPGGMIHVPYHLIDICEPGTRFNIFEYQTAFRKAYDEIRSRGSLPILCGGSGLYVESVIRGYNLSPVPKDETLRQELATKDMAELTAMLEEFDFIDFNKATGALYGSLRIETKGVRGDLGIGNTDIASVNRKDQAVADIVRSLLDPVKFQEVMRRLKESRNE